MVWLDLYAILACSCPHVAHSFNLELLYINILKSFFTFVAAKPSYPHLCLYTSFIASEGSYIYP